jgi:ABC-2 type transport system ATP-binding protein
MEEAEVADRIALIDSGRIVALGTPRELKARLGGGIVTLTTDDNARAREWLVGRGFIPEPGEQAIMLIHPDPAAILPDLLRNLPVRVERAEVHAPSLEDVFLKLTGRGLEGGAKP